MALGEGEGIGGDDTGVGFDEDDAFGGDFDFSIGDLFDDVGTDPQGVGLDIGSVFDDPTEDIDFDVSGIDFGDTPDGGFDFSFDDVETSLFDEPSFAADFQFEALTFSDDVALFVREHPTLTNIGLGILTTASPALGFAARAAKAEVADFGGSALQTVADTAIDVGVGAVLGPISSAFGSTLGKAVGGGLPGAITAGVVGKGVKGFASRAIKDEISGFQVGGPQVATRVGDVRDVGETRSLLDPEAGPVDIPRVASPENFRSFFESRRIRRSFT